MAKVLTSRFVESVKVEERAEFFDAGLPGFSLRVTKGRKTFTFRYRVGGRHKRLSWKFPAFSLSEAREAAESAIRLVERGEVPSVGKVSKAGKVSSVGQLCDEYNKYLEKTVRKWKNAKGEIENHVRPHLGHFRLDKIAKSDVRAMVVEIEKKYPVAANRVLSRTRALFNWGIANDLCLFDPTKGISKPTKERPVSRILSDDELYKLLLVIEQIQNPGKIFIKLLILSGQRRDDVRCFHYSEIRGDDWVIPAERYKTGREHLVPLTEAMKEIIGAGNGYVISASGGEKPYDGLSKLKVRIDKVSGVSEWTWHDLRRSARTGLSRLGVRPDIAERVIGHSVGGQMGQTYDLYEYRREKLAALETWNDYVLSLAERVFSSNRLVTDSTFGGVIISDTGSQE